MVVLGHNWSLEAPEELIKLSMCGLHLTQVKSDSLASLFLKIPTVDSTVQPKLRTIVVDQHL